MDHFRDLLDARRFMALRLSGGAQTVRNEWQCLER